MLRGCFAVSADFGGSCPSPPTLRRRRNRTPLTLIVHIPPGMPGGFYENRLTSARETQRRPFAPHGPLGFIIILDVVADMQQVQTQIHGHPQRCGPSRRCFRGIRSRPPCPVL